MALGGLVQYDPGEDFTIAIVGDLHVNSLTGLAPELFRLDTGGYYMQSEFQQKLWKCWLDFWAQVAKDGAGTRIIAVLNGDTVEGPDHHHTTQIITKSYEYQHQAALAVLEPMKAVTNNAVVIRGTDPHVGDAGWCEEAIGRDLAYMGLDVLRTEEGNFSHWILRARMGEIGFDIAHHGPMGRLPWTSANLLLRTAVEIELDYWRAGMQPPMFAVRNHNHRFGDSSFNAPVRVLANGCWQGLTSFVNRVKPGATPQIGGLIFQVIKGTPTFRVVNYTRETWIN